MADYLDGWDPLVEDKQHTNELFCNEYLSITDSEDEVCAESEFAVWQEGSNVVPDVEQLDSRGAPEDPRKRRHLLRGYRYVRG